MRLGRGTSTYDGLALAFSIARYLAKTNQSITLFATHYFELTGLSEEIPDVENIHVSAVEHKDEIIFLHSIAQGPASQSYGIQVAQLAGVPKEIVNAAKRELKLLESKGKDDLTQPDLFRQPKTLHLELEDPISRRLAETNPDELTPKEALDLIYEIDQIRKKGHS